MIRITESRLVCTFGAPWVEVPLPLDHVEDMLIVAQFVTLHGGQNLTVLILTCTRLNTTKSNTLRHGNILCTRQSSLLKSVWKIGSLPLNTMGSFQSITSWGDFELDGDLGISLSTFSNNLAAFSVVHSYFISYVISVECIISCRSQLRAPNQKLQLQG